MRKVTFILSLGYWFSAYTLGLLLHPYKTMRDLVRFKIYSPLTLVPLVTWLLIWLGAFAGLRLGGVLLRIIGITSTPALAVYFLAFFFWWATWFLILWQGLLSYLFVRFWFAFRD